MQLRQIRLDKTALHTFYSNIKMENWLPLNTPIRCILQNKTYVEIISYNEKC
jgi:hypothetical protein